MVLSNPDTWDNPAHLIDFCARQLTRGQLAMVLGAGASFGFGLPRWSELTDRLFGSAGVTRPANMSDEKAAESLFQQHLNGDDLKFARLVRDCLYSGYGFDPVDLAAASLVPAISTLAMASSRSGGNIVVTFNFDVVLETYLGYFGLRADPVSRVPAWNTDSDVRVLHPHGILKPFGDVDRGVVYCLSHFDRIVGDSAVAWHRVLVDVFSSHTCLFIGLSGDDPNLTQLLTKTKTIHASREAGHAYWGVRLPTLDAAQNEVWEPRGVKNNVVDHYDKVPEFLLAVCRRAKEMRQPTP